MRYILNILLHFLLIHLQCVCKLYTTFKSVQFNATPLNRVISNTMIYEYVWDVYENKRNT